MTTAPTMRVTADRLRSRGAGGSQVELFVATFGDSVDLTAEAVARAAEVGLNLDWFAFAVLGTAAHADYERVMDAARAEFTRARDAAWADFKRVRAAALIAALGLPPLE